MLLKGRFNDPLKILVDAYVLREMHRRCNYDLETIQHAKRLLENEYFSPNGRSKQVGHQTGNAKFDYYVEQFKRSTLASAVIFPYLTEETVASLSDDHLVKLHNMAINMLEYKPFPLVTVHDEFKSHANNVNWVRWNYKEILADIADSNVLDDLLTQIHGFPGSFPKLSFNLGDLIRNSSYALC